MKIKILIGSFLTLFLFLATQIAFSDIKKEGKKGKADEIQRASTGVYDVQFNTVSNISFPTSNYGIFGLDVANGLGGGLWPRGSLNHYIFGGGIWFGTMRINHNDPNHDTTKVPLVEISYNPNNGRSWFVPGRIDDGDAVLSNETKKYRVYFSTDFTPSNGSPRKADDGPNWPIWDASPNPKDFLKYNRYFGWYISDVNMRDKAYYPKGPAFISGEDIFATFKDTDLNRFDGGKTLRSSLGYPLRLQIEHTIYSWGFGDYKDFIFLRYDIINRSNDTLWDSWMAPVMDVDIARAPQLAAGATNDRVRYYNEDPSLNLAFQWTMPDRGERGYGFGYLGFDFLESPAVIKLKKQNGGDSIAASTGFIRKDSAFYANSSQLGLKTFTNWTIDLDPSGDQERYNFLSSGRHDGDNGPGDKRFMMATGPFNMRPGDTVRVIVGMILASPSVQKEADGSTVDVQELVRKDKFAQVVYDNNFRAPQPPDRAVFLSYTPYNNAIKVTWDSTSDISLDLYERGLGFMGYRLYRARRLDLDTFNVSTIAPTTQYSSGQGPLGWKQVAAWSIPTPFLKSYNRAGLNDNDLTIPFIDSMRIVGPLVDENNNIADSNAIVFMRVPRGAILIDDLNAKGNVTNINTVLGQTYKSFYNKTYDNSPYGRNSCIPILNNYGPNGFNISMFDSPWGQFFAEKMKKDSAIFGPFPHWRPTQKGTYMFDSVMTGVAHMNTAVLGGFNPLYFDKKTIAISKDDTARIMKNNMIYLTATTTAVVKDSTDPTKTVTATVTINVRLDSVYVRESLKRVDNGSQPFVIDLLYRRDIRTCMQDTIFVRKVLDSLYRYIKNGKVTLEMPDFERSDTIRGHFIPDFMKKITNNRSFIDIGDDNKNNIIETDPDPRKTEKLINNVEYYYRLLAYDEGDYLQPTPTKLNDAFPGLPDFVTTYPKAPPASNPVSFQIIYLDSNKLGGLYNFNFFAIDADKVNQIYGGDTLELDFQPYWQQYDINLSGVANTDTKFGLYQRHLTLRDISSPNQDTLYDGICSFEAQPCDFSWYNLPTENAWSCVLTKIDSAIIDTVTNLPITFHLPESKEIRNRPGKFLSGDFSDPNYCYANNWKQTATGILGFSFDYFLQQYGGIYRADSTMLYTYKVKTNATTPVNAVFDDSKLNGNAPDPTTDRVYRTQQVGIDPATNEKVSLGLEFRNPVFGSFNNGPAQYLVEFTPGGTERMSVAWGGELPIVPGFDSSTVDVPYLNIKITNLISYYRPLPNGDSVKVSYPGDIPFIELDTIPSLNFSFPTPLSLGLNSNDFINKYNLYAFGIVHKREKVKVVGYNKLIAHPLDYGRRDIKNTYNGVQNRYYMSAFIKDSLYLDFTNIITISGVQFGLDFANSGYRGSEPKLWDALPDNLYTDRRDFQVGDQIMLKTFGGALGIPLPGAKVQVKISEGAPDINKYTDGILDQVNVVPNPYYISQQGQKSPYDSKIYFTRLPTHCIIDIYNLNGELVRSLNHQEIASPFPDKEAMEVFDLLTSNGQRVQSQAFIAVITVPESGAKTIKNFTVVVGGFKITQ